MASPLCSHQMPLQFLKSAGQFIATALFLCLPFVGAQAASRATNGLQALYDFSSTDGAIVKDRSGVGEPVNLRISNPHAVVRSKGSLTVRGKTIIESTEPPGRIIEAVRRSNELTIEAWIRPADDKQTGPARIVTLSRNGTER
ncbi:MAG: hypothetical protein O2960_26550, partial [Verrucomicrobia bacterium]|nr:hypothetical protein [Verrucomicrobiota bacterium]